MNIANDTPLMLGWVVGKIDPPKWTASVFLKGTFALTPSGPLAWAEEPALLSGDVHVDDDLEKPLAYASDFAPMKPWADVLVKATAHAPGGQPVATFPVSIRVGKWSKSLTVFGARQWKRGLVMTSGTTPPAPVAAVPLTYENAFGGVGFAKNPVGRGRKGDDAPLVEVPGRSVRGPSDDAEPASFGPLSPYWPQRTALRGTYDKAWVKTRWPWFPKDFDWGYFNAAPRDQQIEGYLVGNEDLELENLHPEIPLLKTKLPGLRPRCFVADVVDNAERFREVPLALDTLWVDVAASVVILTWRGRIDVKTFKLREVDRIVVAAEKLSDKPSPAESYRALPVAEVEPPPAPPDLEAEKKWAAFEADFAAMNEQFAAMDAEMSALENEAKEAEAVALAKAEKLKSDMIAAGVDPAKFAVPPPPELTAVQSFDQTLAKVREKDPAAAAKAELHRPWIAQAEADLAAMPKEMEAMEKALVADFAAGAPEFDKEWTRELVIEAAAAGHDFTNQNLAELDLHDLTLSGLNFQGAVLSKANLAGCRLVGTDLRDCDLTEADFTKADLSQAKLGDADLTGAILAEAVLAGVSLVRATLGGIDLAGANLSDCNAEGADFAGAKLAGTKFDRARLIQVDFTAANLEGVSFRGAQMRAALCEGVKAKGIECEGADLAGLHGSEADFTGGGFKLVNAPGAIFTASKLDNAHFNEAKLAKAQFDDASLRGARFDRADLAGAMFDDADLHQAMVTRSNVLRASFDRANLMEADCRGSNFYEAGFWDATTEKADFREANLKGTLLRG